MDSLYSPVLPAAAASAPSARMPVAELLPRALVKELHSGHPAKLLAHFLALGEDDRYLRFGRPISDEAIAQYVERIDWQSSAVFGVFDESLGLVGVAHLATIDEAPANAPSRRCAEFGVSVLPSARGKGVGTRLFDRSIVHARNAGIDTFYMQCLAKNAQMLRIARKARMRIEIEYGEANAYLTLPEAHLGTHIAEAFEEQLAAFDLRLKKELQAANDRLSGFSRALSQAA